MSDLIDVYLERGRIALPTFYLSPKWTVLICL